VADLTVKDLLEAGVHFGHQTRRWNPKMKKYIFTERNDIYIIDLQKTLNLINKTCDAVRTIVAKGGSVLFVGTKPQAATIIREEAEKTGQYYVVNRWLGGMLTNYRTIRQSVKRLEHFERMATDGTYDLITKKEILTTEKQKDKLQDMLGGIRDMTRIPGLMIVVDTKREHIAVREANRMKIPVCAIVDTNSDPDIIDFPIPGNDDAIRSIKIILSRISNAIIEGLHMREEKESLEQAAEEKIDGADDTGAAKGMRKGGKTVAKAKPVSVPSKPAQSDADAIVEEEVEEVEEIEEVEEVDEIEEIDETDDDDDEIIVKDDTVKKAPKTPLKKNARKAARKEDKVLEKRAKVEE